jgi:hypothetical protein
MNEQLVFPSPELPDVLLEFDPFLFLFGQQKKVFNFISPTKEGFDFYLANKRSFYRARV